MTYAALLKRLQNMTPAELRQTVKLEEGCSGNVTTLQGMYKARTDMYYEELERLAAGKANPDGTEYCWKQTAELKFKQGQHYGVHDH